MKIGGKPGASVTLSSQSFLFFSLTQQLTCRKEQIIDIWGKLANIEKSFSHGKVYSVTDNRNLRRSVRDHVMTS